MRAVSTTPALIARWHPLRYRIVDGRGTSAGSIRIIFIDTDPTLRGEHFHPIYLTPITFIGLRTQHLSPGTALDSLHGRRQAIRTRIAPVSRVAIRRHRLSRTFSLRVTSPGIACLRISLWHVDRLALWHRPVLMRRRCVLLLIVRRWVIRLSVALWICRLLVYLRIATATRPTATQTRSPSNIAGKH